jgi:hypothetical protein
MKLLFCNKCFDVRRVHQDGITTCDCGESSALYTDDLPHVEVQGEHAHKIFVDNRDVANAIFLTPEGPARLYAIFDWRTHPGWKGGTWLRAEDVWELERGDDRSDIQSQESDR